MAAKTGSRNSVSRPPAIMDSVSLALFSLYPSYCLSLPICLCWQTSLDIIHQEGLAAGEEGLPWISVQTLMPPSWPPTLRINSFGSLLLATNLRHCAHTQCFMCTSEMVHGELSQELPRGDFSSWHAFPMAGFCFRRGSQFRMEPGLIGMPPPTVPACVFFSVAVLQVHNIDS